MQTLIHHGGIRNASSLFLSAVLLGLAGCAPVTPHWETRFGDSVRTTMAQQILDPQASANTDPVSGIDGRAADEAMKRYHESFQKPPPPPPLFQIMTTTGGGN